jgi:uncharacterized protein DUF551
MSETWMPVSERLPEPGTWVLVWTGRYHWIAMISPTFNVWVGTYENEYWSEPTHWMSLPAPPTASVR